MLSRSAEHALRAILYLARHGGDEPLGAADIAEAIGAPPKYLPKMLNALGREGIVAGSRGRRGGFVLTVPPERLTVADVVSVFDEPLGATMCLLGGRPCDARDPCAAHAVWTEAVRSARAPLERLTIAELLAGEGEAGQRYLAGSSSGWSKTER